MGGPKTPDVPAAPAPTATPQPSDTAPQQTEEQRQSKVANMKKGVLSTICFCVTRKNVASQKYVSI